MSASRCIFALGLAILCLTSTTLAGDTVPVLIWGGQTTSTAANPLHKTSSAEFEKLFTEKVGGDQPPVIVFVWGNLCTEDLSKNKKVLSQLDKSNSLTYLPAVESPLPVLKEFESYNISSEEKPEAVSNGQMVLTQVADFATVPEIYKQLLESSDNLIALITGKSCGYSRSERTRRAAVSTRAASDYPIVADRFLMYATGGPYIKVAANGSYYELSSPTVSTSGIGTTSDPLRLLLSYNTSIDNITEIILGLRFANYSLGYYTFEGIEYSPNGANATLLEVTGNAEELIFPYNFSYHCSYNTTYYSGNVYVLIADLQIEIDGSNSTFSDAYDCVGFTTIPIWSGIFVTFILALITIWGLQMIMDIRTMDRFDDPKGKTITVSVTE